MPDDKFIGGADEGAATVRWLNKQAAAAAPPPPAGPAEGTPPADAKAVAEFVLHAMLSHPHEAAAIAAHAAADPAGTAELAAEYAATRDDADGDGGPGGG